MGISTFLIGLVPTYASIGIVGAIIVVCLRSIEGVGIGGDPADGAPSRRRTGHPAAPSGSLWLHDVDAAAQVLVEQCLRDHRVDTDVAVHDLGDAERDRYRRERVSIIPGQPG